MKLNWSNDLGTIITTAGSERCDRGLETRIALTKDDLWQHKELLREI